MITFNDLLTDLGDDLCEGVIDVPAAAHAIGRRLCEALACSQVSVWALHGVAAARVMQRVGGFDATSQQPLAGSAALLDTEYAGYFDTLTRNGLYVCDDTLADTRLAAMRESYLIPQGIRALLDAAVGVNGSTWGVLCCEHRGEVRQWSPQEIKQVKQFADAISLRRARRRAREADGYDLMAVMTGEVVAAPDPAAHTAATRPK